MPGPTGGRASPSPRWARRGAIFTPELAPVHHRESGPAPCPHRIYHQRDELAYIRFAVGLLSHANQPAAFWPKCPAARGTKSGARQAPPFWFLTRGWAWARLANACSGARHRGGISLHRRPRAAFQRQAGGSVAENVRRTILGVFEIRKVAIHPNRFGIQRNQ